MPKSSSKVFFKLDFFMVPSIIVLGTRNVEHQTENFKNYY